MGKMPHYIQVCLEPLGRLGSDHGPTWEPWELGLEGTIPLKGFGSMGWPMGVGHAGLYVKLYVKITINFPWHDLWLVENVCSLDWA